MVPGMEINARSALVWFLIGCPDAMAASLAERAFVQALGATCASPVAAYATVHGDTLRLSGMYADDNDRMEHHAVQGPRDNAEAVGRDLARLFGKG